MHRNSIPLQRAGGYTRIVCSLLVVLFCITFTTAQVRQGVAVDSVESGWLRLVPSQEPGEFWVDSVKYDLNENLVWDLPSGSHRIRVVPKRTEDWMVRSFEKAIVIQPGDTLEVSAQFPEYTMVNSRPFGADVFLGGKILGKTPSLVSRQRAGDMPVRLFKTGFQDTLIRISDYAGPSIWVNLTPDRQEQQARQMMITSFENKNRRDHRFAVLTLGVSVASGVAALLLKDKANRTFDQYLKTGSADEMNRLFNRTEKYDRLSAAAFIVFEANLVASSYLFIRSILRKP